MKAAVADFPTLELQTFIPQMLEWHQAGKFPFDRLVKTFPFDQINEAKHASESGVAIKPVSLV
jgi:Zn-dependent alcohol dehydrogenase